MKYFISIILLTNYANASVESVFFSGNYIYRMKYTNTIKVSHENDASLYVNNAYRQSNYLVGQLAYVKLRENKLSTGAPLRKKEDIIVTKVNELSMGLAEVTYQYDGEVVLDRSGLNAYTVYLPENFKAIENLSVPEIASCSFEPGYVNSEDLLTFYWTPLNKRCNIPFQKVETSLTPVSSKLTYPDYPRLVKDGVISVAILMGKMNEFAANNPYGKDPSATEYQQIIRRLKNLGFEKTNFKAPTEVFQSYEETFEAQMGELKVVVNLVYGNSIYLSDKPSVFDFYEHYMKLAKESSIVVYSGHAGFLLMPGSTTFHSQYPLVLEQDRYQIFVMNACQTTMYEHALMGVKSSKNLDLFVNARESIINSSASTALIDAISKWARDGKWSSYPELVRQMDIVNGMLGVVGEDDNPTEPYTP